MISRETASSGEMLDNSGRKQQMRAAADGPRRRAVHRCAVRVVGTHPAGAAVSRS
jgi:hypothetical protein